MQLLETAVSPYQTCGGLIFTSSPANVQQATIIHREPDFPYMNVSLKSEASNASLKKEKEKKNVINILNYNKKENRVCSVSLECSIAVP